MIIDCEITNFDYNNSKSHGEWLFRIGKDAVRSSKLLIDNYCKDNVKDISYGLLLVAGIELVLKSFLIINNYATSFCLKNHYGRNYKKVYDDCKKFDILFQDPKLEGVITFLDRNFPDIKECRYIENKTKFSFETESFTILEEKLLIPLEEKYKKELNFTP